MTEAAHAENTRAGCSRQVTRVIDDNAPRYVPGHEHVESWFLRGNAPDRPLAFWLKATILARAEGSTVAEAWCSLFDGDRTWAGKYTLPYREAAIAGDPLMIAIGNNEFRLGRKGDMRGSIVNECGHATWELSYEADSSPLGAPLCLLPSRRLIDAPLPRNKLLTPVPVARFYGKIEWDGSEIPVGGWLGMQGHNWGRAHAPEYAWGQCVFTDRDLHPVAMLEGATARIALGPVISPRLSLLVVRNGAREYRFDHLVDIWNQSPDIDFPRWQLRMRGSGGEALVAFAAQPRRMVGLGYHNPRGSIAHCLNSKTAACALQVNPTSEDGFACSSEHAGALEFLLPTPHPEVPLVA